MLQQPFRSRYEMIWRQLKQRDNHTVEVAAPAAAHARLRKAVIKRKDIDLGFKVLTAERQQITKLHFASIGNILRISLRFHSKWDFL